MENRRVVVASPPKRKPGWNALGVVVPQMCGTRWSLLRRLTDNLWMPLVPIIGGFVVWGFNTNSQYAAIHSYDLDRVERVALKQCWTRVVELAPQSETLARRTPQDVCGCAVAGTRGMDNADILHSLLGDAVYSRRLWIEPRAWASKRMAKPIAKATLGTSVKAASVDASLREVLKRCG